MIIVCRHCLQVHKLARQMQSIATLRHFNKPKYYLQKVAVINFYQPYLSHHIARLCNTHTAKYFRDIWQPELVCNKGEGKDRILRSRSYIQLLVHPPFFNITIARCESLQTSHTISFCASQVLPDQITVSSIHHKLNAYTFQGEISR